MVGRLHSAAWLTVALGAIVIASVLTPLCPMPTCLQTGTSACSDFKPACDECPDAVVMKHDPGDAVAPLPVSAEHVALLGDVPPAAAPTPIALSFASPEVTASPPPLDPLGVRLIV